MGISKGLCNSEPNALDRLVREHIRTKLHRFCANASFGYFYYSQLLGLCNTAIDNPTQATKYELVEDILKFIETDTILYFADVSIQK